jgi:hypothetical protein
MDKKYQIFISSTYEDLKEERQAAIRSVLKIGHVPTGMELFHASNDDQWKVITKIIDECDYYLLIIGGRYGSLDDSGISYTEKEYDYAKEIGKPIIAFVHNDDNYLDKSEKNPDKLKQFKEKVMNNKLVGKWENKDALASGIVLGLLDLCKDCPASGWVRGDQIPSDALMMDVIRLQQENADLKDELANTSAMINKSTEHLQKGSDIFTINFSHHVGTIPYSQKVDDTISLSWDEIFRILGPHMLTQISEKNVETCLGEEIASRKKCMYNDAYGVNLHINDADFQQIKIQLLSLKLISTAYTESNGEHTINWILTEYGNEYLLDCFALKK